MYACYLLCLAITLHNVAHNPAAFCSIGNLLFPYEKLQYVNRAAVSVRGALKEPAKSKLLGQSDFSYNVAAWSTGAQGPKTPINSLSKAGKVLG